MGKGVSKLASEMQAAGVRSHSVRKMVAASKTAKQTAAIKKAKGRLKKAKSAKRRYEMSPEGVAGRISRAVTRKKKK